MSTDRPPASPSSLTPRHRKVVGWLEPDHPRPALTGVEHRTYAGSAADWREVAERPPSLLVWNVTRSLPQSVASRLRELRRRHPHLSILALADRGGEIACMEALKAGANDYLLEPRALELAEKLRELLDSAPSAPAAARDDSSVRSETRYLSLAEHAPVGLFLSGPTGEALYVNAGWCAMAGLSAAEALGTGWTQALHPGDRERVLAGWTQAVDGQRSSQNEFRFLRADGSICWVQGNAVILRDGDPERGAVSGYIGSCVDITARKQAEELLLAQRRILESIAADANLPQVLADIAVAVEGQLDRPAVASILLVDEARERLVSGVSPGLPPEFLAAIEGSRIDAGLATCPRAVALNQPVFTPDIRHDAFWSDLGELPIPSWLRAVWSLPIRGSDGRVVGVISTYFHDSHEPGEREKAVLNVFADAAAIAIERRSSRLEMDQLSAEAARHMRLYETFLSTTPDLAYVFDLDHRFIYANHALLSMWGRTAEEAIGRNCLELGYEPWHAAMHDREIELAIATRAPIRGEVPFHGANGRRIYDYIFTPVIGANGEVEAVAGTSRDVTERKREEQRAIFLSELSHRLATLPDEAGIVQATTEALGRLLGSHRCYFVECFQAEDRILVSKNYVRDGAPDLAGGFSLSEFGGADWWRRYSAGDFAVRDVTADPLTAGRAASYAALQVRSYAVQPFRCESAATVVLAVTDNEPRDWTGADLAMLDSVIARVWPLIERARAEAALRESRRQTQLVADHIPALISHIDRELVFRFANEVYRDWFGQPPEELVGLTLRDFLGEATYAERQSYIERARSGEAVRFEAVSPHRRLGPRDIELSFVPETTREGGDGGFYVMAFDITERKRAERTLHRQTERLRLLWEAAGIFLAAEDPDRMLSSLFDKIGPHLEADAYFNFMVTVPGETLELRSCAGLPAETVSSLHTLSFGQAICGAVAATGRPIAASYIQNGTDPRAELVRGLGFRAYACNPLIADGRLLGTLSFASRRRDDFTADELEFMETISHYVTGTYARIKLLDDLREIDRRKDHFLATLAHELRNPLAPILTGLEVMRHHAGDATTIERVSGMMQRQTSQIVHLIDDLLDVSRITTGKIVLKRAVHPLLHILRSALEASEPLIREARHELMVTFPDENLAVDADPHRIAQVVSNLLSNAAKYTPPGGRIRLDVHEESGVAVIRVSDNGFGIAPAAQRKIFDLFEQNDHGRNDGLGIGLTLVKSLVEMHGGSVAVESAGIGQGSAFRVHLPLVPRSSDSAEPPSAAEAAASVLRRRKVLVVDDGKSAADVLAMFFEQEGMETRVAYDGEEAVATVADFQPDLVCMDLGMPRMDGFEAARRMREHSADVVLIALSGWGREEDKRRTAEAGFDHHLIKPVSPADLREVMAKYLSPSGEEPANPPSAKKD